MHCIPFDTCLWDDSCCLLVSGHVFVACLSCAGDAKAASLLAADWSRVSCRKRVWVRG
eukprot:m.121409 g.121409  ORF g.121409 m.121409 type:complete len:58 (-) comp11083_c2_seq1:168-341(-)